MDYKTLQEYVDSLVTDITALQTKYQTQIAADQNLEANVAMLSNFMGNAKHYIHELNTAMNSDAQFLILEATNKGVVSSQESLNALHQKDIMSEEEFIVLYGKIANLSLLVRSAIDPDYVE